MNGGISEPGMGTYPPRVRQNGGVHPRETPAACPAPHDCPLIGRGWAGRHPRPMGLGLGKRWDEKSVAYVLYLYTWYCSGLLLGCTLHGRVVNGYTTLTCTRSSA